MFVDGWLADVYSNSREAFDKLLELKSAGKRKDYRVWKDSTGRD